MYSKNLSEFCFYIICCPGRFCFCARKKIAVPAIGSEPGATISKETGRAPFFLVFDEMGNFLEAIQNPARDQSGGISRTVVALLTSHDIRLIVAESIGDKMKQALTDHRIDFVIKTGAAADAVKSIVL